MLLIIMVVIGVASFAICMRSGKCNRKKANPPSASSPTNDDDDYLSTNYNYRIPMRPDVDKINADTHWKMCTTLHTLLFHHQQLRRLWRLREMRHTTSH